MGASMLFARDAEPTPTFFKLLVEVRLVLPAIALDSITRFCRKRLLGET